MSRSAAEIIAEAHRLDGDAQTLKASAQARLLVAQQTIATAQATASNAQNAASAALAAITADNIVDAEARCYEARSQIIAARSGAAQAFAGVAGGDPKEEWKECRASIGRFDQLLVDLRKTGFGFVTTIVTAVALLASRLPSGVTMPGGGAAFGAGALPGGSAAPGSGALAGVTILPSNPFSEKLEFATLVIIEVLIITLFAVDCIHQAWLRATVMRARQLENSLNYETTSGVTSVFGGADSVLLGPIIYAVLFAITTFIFYTALEGSPPYPTFTILAGLSGGLLMLAITVGALWRSPWKSH
jgi:hypothetical protein